MKCRKCGKSPRETQINLKRVNEKGIPAIWECYPGCGQWIPQEVALLDLIQPSPGSKVEAEQCCPVILNCDAEQPAESEGE